MSHLCSRLVVSALLVLMSMVSTQAAAFPEIPFCPLGGPPGWANRIFNDRDDYYPPPPYYGAPHWQGYPQYSPAYPGAYPYGWQVPPSYRWRE